MSGKMSGKGGVLSLTQRRGGAEAAEMVRLGEVCEIIGGGTPSKTREDFYKGDIPWATVRDMNCDVIRKTEFCITSEAVKQSATNIIPSGEVVISTHVGLGKVCILGQDTAINQDLKAIIPEEGIDRRYLYYWFCSQANHIVRNGKGATVKGVTLDFIRGLELPLPPLPEQKRIAATLDRICELKKNAEVRLAKLDLLVKSRFVEMFGEGHYPRENVSNIAETTGGLTKNGKRPTFPLTYRYLRVANVFFNRLDLSDVQEIGVMEAEVEKTLLKKNDLLFVEGNGSIEQIGRVALWNGEIEPCLHQNHLIKVRFHANKINPVFALFYFMSGEGRRQIKECAVSTTGLHTLSTGKVARLSIPLPPLALQREFAAFVEKVEKLKEDARRSADRLDVLYRSKLQEYFG